MNGHVAILAACIVVMQATTTTALYPLTNKAVLTGFQLLISSAQMVAPEFDVREAHKAAPHDGVARRRVAGTREIATQSRDL